MKIECVQEKISQAVATAAPITGKDLSLPVLECVLLTAEDGNLTVKATNLEIGVEITIPVKVKESGTVAVSADVLRNFLSTLPYEGKVELKTAEKRLEVTTAHSDTNIKTQAHDEFPSIPRVEDGKEVNLDAQKLTSGFESVYYSASPSSMKPELSSVNMFVEDNEIVFVATDSFRLAEKRVSADGVTSFDSVLIPFQNVAEITQIFGEGEGGITVEIGQNQVSFTHGDVYVTSRVIDGVFPDYKQIIPESQDTHVTVLTQDLKNTLKLSNIFADKFNQVTLTVAPEDKTFTIRTNNDDVGENEGALDATLEGGGITAHFNYRYIMDCFQSISADSVKLDLSDGKPMTIRGVGDDSFLYLVMPMNK